jgi:hypothetical protein
MELLQKDKPRDVLNYVVAYLLVIVTVAVAVLAITQLRNSIFIVANAITSDRLWLRVINMISWVIQLIAFAVYVLIVEHAYREAVTQARIRSARTHPGIDEPKTAFYRFLRRFDLDILASLFVKFVAGTTVVAILLFGLHRLLLLILAT